MNNRSFLKKFFCNPYIKCSLLRIVLLVIATAISLKVLFFTNNTNAGCSEPSPSTKQSMNNQSFNLYIYTDLVQGIPIYINSDYIEKSPIFKQVFAGKYVIIAKPINHIGSIRYLTLKSGDEKDQKIILPVDRHSYQEFLDEIVRLGYQTIRVMGYYNHVQITKKIIVMRHDVDVSAEVALKMAEEEHARGIKSTYYFRWSTADTRVIKALQAMGFEVGLHYETLATYAKEYHLKSAQEITPTVKKELRRRLKSEIREFKQRFGEIYTISSHGAEENIKLGVSNYEAIMEGQDPHNYGILGTAYGPITKQFTYMSESDGLWDPFPYPKLENGDGPFYILTHPIHWTTSFNGI